MKYENLLENMTKKREKFPHSPILIMHVHLTGDTLKNKAPYMDV